MKGLTLMIEMRGRRFIPLRNIKSWCLTGMQAHYLMVITLPHNESQNPSHQITIMTATLQVNGAKRVPLSLIAYTLVSDNSNSTIHVHLPLCGAISWFWNKHRSSSYEPPGLEVWVDIYLVHRRFVECENVIVRTASKGIEAFSI